MYCCISTPQLTITLVQAWYEWHLTCRVSWRSATNSQRNVREFHIVWRVVTLCRTLGLYRSLHYWLYCHIEILPDALPSWDWAIFWYQYSYVDMLIRLPVWLSHPTTAAVTWADRHLTAGVVRCCKRTATLGICCSQSSSIVWRCQNQIGGFCSQCDILVLLIKLPLHEVIVEALRSGDVLVFVCFFVRSFFIFSVSLNTFRELWSLSVDDQ